MLCHSCGYMWRERAIVKRGGDTIARCPECGAINIVELAEVRLYDAQMVGTDRHPYRRPFPLGPSTRPIPSPLQISLPPIRGNGYDPEQKGVHRVVRRY